MGKILNSRTYLVIIALLSCIVLALSVRSCFQEREIWATVIVKDIPEGVLVHYADSTKGASRWRWEFGNGDLNALTEAGRKGEQATERMGEFFYPADTIAQRFQIRLQVDGKLEKKFFVDVPAKHKSNAPDPLIHIKAPVTGMEGEYIVFRGEGNSKEWRWSFGESSRVDAREKTAIYRYEQYGTYEVLLETEETKYPVRHTIVIEPQYNDNDTTDAASIIGNDIKARLQAIVNQRPFNENYNYLLREHLCGNHNTLVVINNTKKNDLYSYCQGLRIIGRKKTQIDNVIIDMEINEDGTYCVTKLMVLQTDLN